MINIANNILKLIETLEENGSLGLSAKYDVNEALTLYKNLFDEEITENQLRDTISMLLNDREIRAVSGVFEIKK